MLRDDKSFLLHSLAAVDLLDLEFAFGIE